MKPRLYMETTIPSLLTARPSKQVNARAQQEAAKLWWDKMSDHYSIYVSEVVHKEAAIGEKTKAHERLVLIESFPFLPITDEVVRLADAIMKLGAIPDQCTADAYHLSLSAVHKMDILLTNNMKHICNAHLRPRFEVLCELAGHQMPVICTPDHLLQMPMP